MNIYVVQQVGGHTQEVLPFAFRSEERAKDFVLGRVGSEVKWAEHNSHGTCWVSESGLYIISEVELEAEK